MNYKMMGRFLAQILAIEGVLMLPALCISLYCGDGGAVQGFLDHDGAQIHSGGVLQGTAERTNSGSAAIDDIEIFHGVPPFYVFFVSGTRCRKVYCQKQDC